MARAASSQPARERGRPKELTGLRARSQGERANRARSSSSQSHAPSRSLSQSRFKDLRSGEPFDGRAHTIKTRFAYVCRHGALGLQMTVSNSGWIRTAGVIEFIRLRFASKYRNPDYVTIDKIEGIITYAEQPRFGLLRDERGNFAWCVRGRCTRSPELPLKNTRTAIRLR